MSNYGLMAYRELEELKRRVTALENRSQQATFKEITFAENNFGTAKHFDKNWDFESTAQQTLNFTVSGEIAGSNKAQAVVYVNGVKIRSIYINSQSFSFTASATVDKGKNNVEVRILYVLDFTLNSLKVNFAGAVDHVKIKTKLSVVNFQDKSVVLFGDFKTFDIYEYTGGDLVKKLSVSARDCALARQGEDLLICTINDEKQLSISRLNDSYQLGDTANLDSNVLQVCASKGEKCWVVYALKGSRVFRFDITRDLSFARTRLGFIAGSVYASPNVSEAIIVSDASDNYKLVISDSPN